MSTPPQDDTRPRDGASTGRHDQFEMRRLEALSNTIFGVAMTLLAYDLPRASQFAGVPTWQDLLQAYGARAPALMLSFIIAGLFWFSHHRRLAVAPHGSRASVFINMLFLMSIIVLPATNSLYGAYPSSSAVTVAYSLHLSVIAALNACLWLLALQGRFSPNLVSATLPAVLFLLATAVALVSPATARYVLFLGFGVPLLAFVNERRARAQGAARRSDSG